MTYEPLETELQAILTIWWHITVAIMLLSHVLYLFYLAFEMMNFFSPDNTATVWRRAQ